MTKTLDFYATVRSPYSYLSTSRVRELSLKPEISFCFRPVYPLAIREPEFFSASHPLLLGYLRRDAERVADMLGTRFAWPDPDPVIQDLTTSEIAKDQPHVFYLTRLLAAACEQGAGFAFYEALSSLIFDGRAAWNAPGALARAASDVGLEFKKLHSSVTDESAKYDAILDSNAKHLLDAGHWGTPTLACDGEVFFGQDRIEMCQWHLNKTSG